jgi:3'-5' exoribonuclease
MSRCFVSQLGHQNAVEEVFLASDKQLRPNRSGNLYLQVDLSDRTGSIPTRMWNATESLYRSFDNGDYVRVEGTTQMFQGAMQMIATRIDRVDPREVDEADFLPLPSVEIEKLAARLAEILRGMNDPQLVTLAEAFLLDDEFMTKFTRAPAGIKLHHAYHGGLLEHVVTLMEVVLRVAPCYPQLDRDLLLVGAFLHDVGKIDELSYQRELAYTVEGQLLGHLVIAVGILEKKLDEAEKLSGERLPEETVLRIKHMLLSHHGEYEHGSPKLPMTLEAMALHLLDHLDAKLNGFDQLMRDDPNVDSPWTHYHANLGRKLFKGAKR